MTGEQATAECCLVGVTFSRENVLQDVESFAVLVNIDGRPASGVLRRKPRPGYEFTKIQIGNRVPWKTVYRAIRWQMRQPSEVK